MLAGGIIRKQLFENEPDLQHKLRILQQNSRMLSIDDLLFFQQIAMKFGIDLVRYQQTGDISENITMVQTKTAADLVRTEQIVSQMEKVLKSNEVQMNFVEEYQGKISHDLSLTGTEVARLNDLYDRVLKKNSLNITEIAQKIDIINQKRGRRLPDINSISQVLMDYLWLLPARSKKYHSSTFKSDILYILDYLQKQQKLPESAFEKILEVYEDYFEKDNHRFAIDTKIVPFLMGTEDRRPDKQLQQINYQFFRAFLLADNYPGRFEIIDLSTLNFRQTDRLVKYFDKKSLEFKVFLSKATLIDLNEQQNYLVRSVSTRAADIYKVTGVLIPEIELENISTVSSHSVLNEIEQARSNDQLLSFVIESLKKTPNTSDISGLLKILEQKEQITAKDQQKIRTLLVDPSASIDRSNYQQLISKINNEEITVKISQLAGIREHYQAVLLEIIMKCYQSPSLIFDLDNIQPGNRYYTLISSVFIIINSKNSSDPEFLTAIEYIQQKIHGRTLFAVKENQLVFNFGKNRGLSVTAKKDYLRWMLNDDFPLIIKFICSRLLSC